MKSQPRRASTTVWCYSLLTMLMALIIGIMLLNPVWERYSPPFEMPKVLPAITAPVDGPFYLRNADYGYQWDTKNPLSLWFHPLMSYLVMIMPEWLPSKIWFWLISIAFAVGSIVLTYRLVCALTRFEEVPARLLPFLLLAPGGLSVATGNAEIPTLFFTSALLLSVTCWQKWWLTASSAALAVLTKPNALYMFPVLLVYLISGWLEQDSKLWRQALTGMVAFLVTWMTWIGVVDWQTGYRGTYWSLRMSTRQYVAGDPWTFFVHLARSFIYWDDTRDQIRYSTALIIPVVNLWIVGLIPLSHERHQFAIAGGNLAMLAIALLQGNPNKIIVYTTTLPGHFATHILLVRELMTKESFSGNLFRAALIAGYATYCIGMLVVYIFGTPLGWYY